MSVSLRCLIENCHEKRIRSVAYGIHGNHKHIFTGGEDCLIKVWTWEGDYVSTYRGHAGWISDLHFLPDKFLFSSSTDGCLCVWDTTNHCLLQQYKLDSPIYSIGYSRLKKLLVVGTKRGVQLFKVNTMLPILTPAKPPFRNTPPTRDELLRAALGGVPSGAAAGSAAPSWAATLSASDSTASLGLRDSSAPGSPNLGTMASSAASGGGGGGSTAATVRGAAARLEREQAEREQAARLHEVEAHADAKTKLDEDRQTMTYPLCGPLADEMWGLANVLRRYPSSLFGQLEHELSKHPEIPLVVDYAARHICKAEGWTEDRGLSLILRG